MTAEAVRVAPRPRAFVAVRGRDAAGYLERMLSNDVASLPPGESREALLLTPKARVVAPVTALRRGEDDFLLLTEPDLGDVLRAQLVRSRFAARVEIEPESHTSTLVLGRAAGGVANRDYGVPAVEVLDEPVDGDPVGEDELEALRVQAGAPRWGREIDDRVLPAEAGLVERAVSLTKGCYPGQEPVARLHYRGRANRSLRALEVVAAEPPPYDAALELDGKVVGRVTTAVRDGGRVLALAYVRREVPGGAELRVGGAVARPLDSDPSRP